VTEGVDTRFPAGFRWGAAIAAYQVEGAVHEDGRGESIWDRFAATPGKILDGDDASVACDSYHRSAEDLGLVRELGLGAFRFSIAWPRVLPQGRGPINRPGLDFYDRLVDELLAGGVEPYVTLYHWDLPQTLEDAGGWPVRDTIEAYAEYVEVVADRLGDRVRHWITQNEPWVIGWMGYGTGQFAPGRRSEADALAAVHHVLVAHGRAVEILRRRSGARVGLAVDLVALQPASDSEADLAATRAADGYRNRWFLDPVLKGEYPADMLETFAAWLPTVLDGDMRTISVPLDFLGVNYYSRNIVRAGGVPHRYRTVTAEGAPHTEMGWEVYPDGLLDLLVRLRDEYDVPAVAVTENGAAFADVRGTDRTVDDPGRVAYLQGHVDAVARAIAQGVPVEGYFVWSLLDNFEWALGYSKRFGLVYVDYETLERVPKSSYRWYRDFIRAQGEQTPAS
jgi:beta-glucosidase